MQVNACPRPGAQTAPDTSTFREPQMSHHSRWALPVAGMALLLASTGVQAGETWQTSGDVSFGYVSSETRTRTDTSADSDGFRARARLRVRGELGGGWHASGRLAARLGTGPGGGEFWLRDHAD